MPKFPEREVIEYEATSNVSTNDELIGNDFDTVEGDRTLASNEVFEVERIELLPPVNNDGTLDTFEHIRLHDGEDYYPNIRYRAFQLGYLGPSFSMRTPRLGQPVLENKVDPNNRPILTACPKFGPDDVVNIALQNDGTQIDQDFSVRVIGWRFKGTEQEMQNYFAGASNLSTNINQGISVSNPFDGESGFFPGDPVNITSSSRKKAHTQFTKLTGGVNQNLPKVWPWATWADNQNATEANTPYELSFAQSNVNDKWQEMFFNHADGQDAHLFNYLMVQEDVANLKKAQMKLESRARTPDFNVEDNDQHELPFIRRYDGTSPEIDQVEEPIAHAGGRGVQAVSRVPKRISDVIQPAETMVWNDEGGVALLDDGTSISANTVTVGAQGYKMELEG